MTSYGDTGGSVVTSTEHTEGHEVMDEDQISDVGITETWVTGLLLYTLETFEDIGLKLKAHVHREGDRGHIDETD